jgi:hypothetical protein
VTALSEGADIVPVKSTPEFEEVYLQCVTKPRMVRGKSDSETGGSVGFHGPPLFPSQLQLTR